MKIPIALNIFRSESLLLCWQGRWHHQRYEVRMQRLDKFGYRQIVTAKNNAWKNFVQSCKPKTYLILTSILHLIIDLNHHLKHSNEILIAAVCYSVVSGN